MPILLKDIASQESNIITLETRDLKEFQLKEYLQGEDDFLRNYTGFVMEGIFAKADVKNRNNRVYSLKLWQKVIGDEKFKKRLIAHNILGELSHPEYTDVNMKQSAILILDMKLLPNGDVTGLAIPTVGTPDGDLLIALLKLGVKPAVSSRGYGDVENRNGVDYVIEDTFNYVTHDLTLDPSVEIAWPKVFVKEQLERFDAETASILERYSGKISEEDKQIHKLLKESVLNHATLSDAAACFCTKLPTITEQKELAMPEQDVEKTREMLNTITTLTTDKVELSNKLAAATTENAELSKKLSKLGETDSNYAKAQALVEMLNTKLSASTKTNSELLSKLKETESKVTKLESVTEELVKRYKDLKANSLPAPKVEAVIKEVVGRFKILESNHVVLVSKHYPALYEKALKVIEGIRSKFLAQKKDLAEKTKKLESASGIAEGIQKRIKEEKIERVLTSELEAVGGKDLFKDLLENVTSVEDAKKRVKAIREMVEKKPYTASYIPNFTPAPTAPIRETKKLDEKKVEEHPYLSGKRRDLSETIARVS